MPPGQELDAALGALGAERLRAADPLLPDTPEEPGETAGCGAEFTAAGPDGRVLATGWCEHWTSEPGSLELTWGAARRFRLIPRIAGPDVGPALDELIASWRAHLAGLPGTGDQDSAASITWPSRDVGGITTLLGHGLSPMAVIAARPSWHSPAGPAREVPAPAGARIRRAGPDDLGTLARLGLEVVRYDALFRPVVERPDTLDGLRHELAGLLAGPEPWSWLAERDGQPVGMLVAEPPAHAAWIAPMVRQSPAAYLFLAYVQPQERRSGIGAALADCLHQEIARAGVAVTLLHYAQSNPLSAPFWSQQGYRPLWTSWQAWPTSALR